MSLSFVLIGNTDAGMELSRRIVAAGYPAAPDIEQADVVVTYCPGLDRLGDVYFEAGGVIARVSEGAYVVDLSPATPTLSKEIAAMALVNGAHPVEAPLYVREPTAKNPFSSADNLGLFLAGDADDIKVVEGLLAALASHRVVCGETGSAQVARGAQTLVDASRIVGIAEAVALIRSANPACEQVGALVESLSAKDAQLLTASHESNHAGAYTVEIAVGEIEAAMATADEAGLVMPQAEAAEYLLRMLNLIGGANYCVSATSLLYLDETAAAKQGLDWSRAEDFYAEMSSSCDHNHAHDGHEHPSYADDIGDYDDGFESEYGYSSN